MPSRRKFLRTVAGGAAAGVAASMLAAPAATGGELRSPDALPMNTKSARSRPAGRFGLGGCALGNLFAPAPEDEFLNAVNTAWNEGVRYFDTSPWYGLGLSERRLGVFLQGRPRDEFVVSSKVGRLLTPDASRVANRLRFGMTSRLLPIAMTTPLKAHDDPSRKVCSGWD